MIVKSINFDDEKRIVAELKELGKNEIINYIKKLRGIIKAQEARDD